MNNLKQAWNKFWSEIRNELANCVAIYDARREAKKRSK